MRGDTRVQGSRVSHAAQSNQRQIIIVRLCLSMATKRLFRLPWLPFPNRLFRCFRVVGEGITTRAAPTHDSGEGRSVPSVKRTVLVCIRERFCKTERGFIQGYMYVA